MSTRTKTLRLLSAQEFFKKDLEGGRVSDAARATGITYQSVHAIKHGAMPRPETAKRLEEWSKTVPKALASRVRISAAKTLGLVAL